MDHHAGRNKRTGLNGEFTPVCVALGMIILALSIGAHTVKQQLMHSPGVRVSKKKREMVVEVEDPDQAAGEADRFVSKSILRKVAHLQDFDTARSGTSDPTRPNPYNHHRTLETLKSVGVNSGNN
ncbi:uncharacterized protein [Typha latifolia]|uniref:uncharacterized protein n=1 Tax=Typha latifolia TaxID=4733 RepID=UPI003C2ED1C7